MQRSGVSKVFWRVDRYSTYIDCTLLMNHLVWFDPFWSPTAQSLLMHNCKHLRAEMITLCRLHHQPWSSTDEMQYDIIQKISWWALKYVPNVGYLDTNPYRWWYSNRSHDRLIFSHPYRWVLLLSLSVQIIIVFDILMGVGAGTQIWDMGLGGT